MQLNIEIKNYRNNQINEMRPIVNEMGFTHYKKFPYFYVHDDVPNFRSCFENDPNALLVCAEKNSKVIAILEAIPLNSSFLKDTPFTPFPVLQDIKNKGFNIDQTFYISGFIVNAEERLNKKMILNMFNNAVDLAKSLGKTQICFMELIGDENHPLKPDPYVPVEPWHELGVEFRKMDVSIDLAWPTLQPDNSVKEQVHTLTFFIGDI